MALALCAQEQGIAVHLIGRIALPWVRERLRQEGVSFTLLDEEIPARERAGDVLPQIRAASASGCLVFDGYHFDLACQQAVRDAGYRLLLIDDYAHLPEYSCDILLNQNIGAEDFVYRGDIGRTLLGPEYALLRPEFVAARQKAEVRQFSGKVRNILLTLGGGDCSEYLARIAPDFSLPELQGRTLRVIAGGMPQERVRELLQNCMARLEILGRVDDMPALLLDTDLCVTAGGSTCWELCCLGVPFLTVEVAENQHAVMRGLQECGIAPMYTPDAFVVLMEDGTVRRKHADTGRGLVDGLGAGRIVCAMAE